MYKTFSIISLLLLFASCENINPQEETVKEEKKRHVGDIHFDSKIDPAPSGFSPCSNAFYSFQYYNFESNGLKYVGEKPQLMKELMANYHPPKTPKESCFITTRFIVNCKGQSGWYRTKVFNEEYKPTEISTELKDAVETAVKSLKSWETKFSSRRDKTMDYHQYLTLRIHDNKIISVVP
jgi:hypothetical protein